MFSDSAYVNIDGADYVEYQYKGKTYFIGEESILDSTKTEIGFICARGPDLVIAATVDRNIIADKWFHGEDGEKIDTEGDVIPVILDLHDGKY